MALGAVRLRKPLQTGGAPNSHRRQQVRPRGLLVPMGLRSRCLPHHHPTLAALTRVALLARCGCRIGVGNPLNSALAQGLRGGPRSLVLQNCARCRLRALLLPQQQAQQRCSHSADNCGNAAGRGAEAGSLAQPPPPPARRRLPRASSYAARRPWGSSGACGAGRSSSRRGGGSGTWWSQTLRTAAWCQRCPWQVTTRPPPFTQL